MCKVKHLSNKLHLLTVFRTLLLDSVLNKLLIYLDTDDAFLTSKLDSYADFVAELYKNGGDLGKYIYEKAFENENAVIKIAASKKLHSKNLEEKLLNELELFSSISALNCDDFAPNSNENMPKWDNTNFDFKSDYLKLLAEISTRGYGVFAKYNSFTLSDSGEIISVKHTDDKLIDNLVGYENERSKILINTKALLNGIPANNILLYGDAGTGKSCTVKVLANEFFELGLRIIEVRKNQLYLIPSLMDKLAENPLKFVVFIDDLSFSSSDENFAELKAILEGTVSARPKNIVVYATSNRRQMIKQSFSERQGDDVHVGDTVEESASLSARFGLTITFLRPDKKLFAEIVAKLALAEGVKLSGKELILAAEAHASRQGGRSPRTAKQFVDFQKAKENIT